MRHSRAAPTLITQGPVVIKKIIVYEVSPGTMTSESFKSLFTFAAIELISQLNLISS